MESGFRRDFDGVRIHRDAEAANAAATLRARAFTLHRDVFLGGQYDYSSPAGEALLAHELTHVAQADAGKLDSSASGTSVDQLELEARQVADAYVGGGTIPSIRGIARDPAMPLRDGPEGLGTFGNLVSSDLVSPDQPTSGYRLRLEFDKGQNKWYEIMPGREKNKRRAAGWYNFVVQDGEIWAEKVKSPFGHVEAARGGRVTYAGQIKFTSHSGQITVWNNGSGHYRPSASFAQQAGLPMDKFKLHPNPVKGVQLPVIQPGAGSSGVPSPKLPASGVTPTPQVVAQPSSGKATKPSTPRPAITVDVPQVKATPAQAPKPRPGLGSGASWGKVGPFDAAMFYLDMHAAHFAALASVQQRAAVGRELLNRVDELELGAREFGRVTKELRIAESQLADYPLQLDEEAGGMSVSDAELAHVEEYGKVALRIAGEAFKVRQQLILAIAGWDTVVAQAEQASDFTRKSVKEAVMDLDRRFHKEGGGFRAYLAKIRDDAGHVEIWAGRKLDHARDILSGTARAESAAEAFGTSVPTWYSAPTLEPR